MLVGSYRALLRRDGAPTLALACGVAWLALSGYTFAVILATRAATGSFADAGGVAATFAVGVAGLAPIRGRAVDARGPRALVALAGAHLLCAAGLVGSCTVGNAGWLIWIAAAATGASAPPLIATARSLWSAVAGPGLTRTGHALNAALSDAAVIAGPGLVGAMAAAFSARVALASVSVADSAMALVVAWLAARPDMRQLRAGVHDTGSARVRAGGAGAPLRQSAGLRTLVAAGIPIGVWLGGLEIAVTAIAARHGGAALGAIPLAAGAAGSCLASITSGSGRVRQSAERRYLIGSVIAAGTLPLTLLHPSLLVLCAALAPPGAGFGVLNVAAFELLDHVVDTSMQAEAFTWLTSAGAAGSAIGAAVAGRLVAAGAVAALLFVFGAALTAAVLVVARRRSLR
jgi:hypothetical protein